MNFALLFTRFARFRRELVTLWQAFMAPETPLHLKGLMLLVPLYLLSPIDIIPDFFPVLGWLDDVIVIPFLVSWITSMLPQKPQKAGASARSGKVIDGSYRRR